MQDIGLVFAIVSTAVGIAGWEWKKLMTLRKEVDSLRVEVNRLHNEHQDQDRELHHVQNEALRDLAKAIQNMNSGVNELVHYIKWLGQHTHGVAPPPPLSSRNVG